jgi:colanic acid/amylovoran biosynthesis glycosyltransferase
LCKGIAALTIVLTIVFLINQPKPPNVKDREWISIAVFKIILAPCRGVIFVAICKRHCLPLTSEANTECIAIGSNKMRIAYFTNQYPAISHTFIRREIRAMEALGVRVFRYALKPGQDLVDADDKAELRETRYVLESGVGTLLGSCLVLLLSRPVAFLTAVRETVKMGRRSDRGILRHLIYVAEAAVLARWCERDAVQHVHAHFGTNAAAIAMLAWRLSGIPYSFTAHGPEEFEKAAWLSLDMKLRNASFAVCVSSFGRSQLMRWSSIGQWPKIAVVHCGVDKGFLDGPGPTPQASARLLCVGRLTEEKAHLVLIGAARRLYDAGIRCEIVLAGDGHMRPHVEEAIRAAGLQREITISGWISGDRVKAEIAAARALILPSFAENMPVVIMEAMALGRPVISTYVAGIPELIQPGKSGWLVPAGDEVALAEAMREALETPVEQLAAMGAAGRLRIIEQHDTFKEAARLKDLFEEHLPAGSTRDGDRQQ